MKSWKREKKRRKEKRGERDSTRGYSCNVPLILPSVLALVTFFSRSCTISWVFPSRQKGNEVEKERKLFVIEALILGPRSLIVFIMSPMYFLQFFCLSSFCFVLLFISIYWSALIIFQCWPHVFLLGLPLQSKKVDFCSVIGLLLLFLNSKTKRGWNNKKIWQPVYVLRPRVCSVGRLFFDVAFFAPVLMCFECLVVFFLSSEPVICSFGQSEHSRNGENQGTWTGLVWRMMLSLGMGTKNELRWVCCFIVFCFSAVRTM